MPPPRRALGVRKRRPWRSGSSAAERGEHATAAPVEPLSADAVSGLVGGASPWARVAAGLVQRDPRSEESERVVGIEFVDRRHGSEAPIEVNVASNDHGRSLLVRVERIDPAWRARNIAPIRACAWTPAAAEPTLGGPPARDRRQPALCLRLRPGRGSPRGRPEGAPGASSEAGGDGVPPRATGGSL